MKTQTTIFPLFLATLLTGCGVKKEDHQRVLTELEETKQALEQSQSELSAASSRASELTAEVERLKKQDSYAFAEAGRLLDSGDFHGALRAYTAFVRNFPSSPQASQAKEQLTLIEREIEAQRRELAARTEREQQEKEQRELAERVRSGNLTAYQWWPILRGKTMQQVKDLLGTPGHTADNDREWTYYRMAVGPNSGIKEWLNVYFREGVVRGVSSQSLNSIIQD